MSVQIDPNEIAGWIAHLTNEDLLTAIEKQCKERRHHLAAERARLNIPHPNPRNPKSANRPQPPDQAA